MTFLLNNIQANLTIDGWGICCEITIMNVSGPVGWYVNIGSGNGMVNPSSESMPRTMSLGHNELD